MESIFIFLIYSIVVVWQCCRILMLKDKIEALEIQKEQFAIREQLLKDSYEQVKSMLLNEVSAINEKVKQFEFERESSNQ